MTEPKSRLVFSVIIPTRNRASVFAIALQSVLDQRFRAFEVIVVDDGSSEEHAACYRNAVAAFADKVRLLTLVRTQRGHGQAYAINFGTAHAQGDYCCFLDDDDQWTDPEHLNRTAATILACAEPVDLVLADQQAFRNGSPIDRVVWIEDLRNRLKGPPDAAGAYTVTVPELLLCQAHCHLNTTIISRDLHLEIGGLDEGLRYECDRDFYLRAIDRARVIKFLPHTVSRHNIPDPMARANMSTSESEMSKRLYQLRVLDKAALFATHPELRRYAMRHRLYVLEFIAVEALRMGRTDCAFYYRREALLAKLALGWLRVIRPLARRWQVSGLPAPVRIK